MRDGLLFGLALFFAFGTFMFSQGVYYTYHDICHENLSASRPVYCDQTTLFSTGALAGFSAFISLSCFYLWWGGRKEVVA